jgi:hypothetical protein
MEEVDYYYYYYYYYFFFFPPKMAVNVLQQEGWRIPWAPSR